MDDHGDAAVRDYCHVVDCARAHIAAIAFTASATSGTSTTANIGSGRPVTVIQMIEAFQRAAGVKVRHSL